MTSAGEVFVVQIARASRKANRFLRLLSKPDREDILANALLWCWEHRESYSLTTSIDTWFVNAVRDAYKQWQRNELRNGAGVVDEIPTGDSTLATVEAWEAATKLAAALPPDYRRVAWLDAQGYTRAEMERRGLPRRTINETRARIKQLRKLVPDEHEYKRVIRTPAATASDHDERAPAAVDKDIEQLEATPSHGADCPPCWLCKYFYGYLPGEHRRVRMVIQEPEVRDAVRDTEARKVEIAERVRYGRL